MRRWVLVVFAWALCLGGAVQARVPDQAVITAKVTADAVLA